MSNREQEIEHLEKLRARHQANIRKLEEMLAGYGMDRPLPLLNNLEFEQEQVRQVEEQLAALRGERPEEAAEEQTTPAPTGGRQVTASGERAVAVGGDVKGNVIITQMTAEASRDFWQRFAARRLSKDELHRATSSYLKHLVDRYRYLDFKGMGVSDRVPLRLPLLEMYVPLKARIELPQGETWARQLQLAGRKVSAEEAEMMGRRLSEPRPALELLRENDGLIILGDPGAGKTTFLKYLALRLAIGEGEALGLGKRLPVLLPLSAYANVLAERDVPLNRFIDEYYQDRGVDLPLGPMLDEALAQGGALLLLDGLDEVRELSQRHLVVERVVDFFTFQRQKGNKCILTSRIVGYREVRPIAEGLAECTLVDFEEEEIEQFVGKWTGALERAARGETQVAEYEAEREREELLTAMRRNPGVRQLASNPLLLTILALMKRQGVTLPERRVELYEQYVRTLLKNWNLARGLDRPPSRDLDVVETVRVLAPLALWMHETSPGVGLVKREEMRRRLEQIYAGREMPDPEGAARQLLEDVHDYAGLLLERGPGEYGFIHLTFQEYLAAVAIAQQGQLGIEPVVEALTARLGDDNWREVALLTIGYVGIVEQRDKAAGATLAKLIEAAPGEPGPAAVLAGEAVADAWPGGVTPACKERVVRALVETLGDEKVQAPLRAESGRVLARLGDPRPGVCTLPPEWVEIPGGEFVMGEGREQHKVNLPAFYISRYPITNAQYKLFVEAGGYRERKYWTEAGWKWKKDRAEPERYGPPFDLPNHPVVVITWYEAVAFCRWLSEEIGQEVRLPSEAEWEKAARGTDGREWPWGNEFDAALCNVGDTRIGTTSAVGCFPGGASPYGVLDMAGNVWEWTRSLYSEYPYRADDGREDAEAGGRRVLRGGSWFDIEWFVRCASRDWSDPLYYNFNYGFRVVALSPLFPTSGL